MKTIYLWPKAKQLNAVSQKNKQSRMLCSSFLTSFSLQKIILHSLKQSQVNEVR